MGKGVHPKSESPLLTIPTGNVFHFYFWENVRSWRASGTRHRLRRQPHRRSHKQEECEENCWRFAADIHRGIVDDSAVAITILTSYLAPRAVAAATPALRGTRCVWRRPPATVARSGPARRG